MVIFDQLRISDDGQSMFINAHVNTAAYFDNVQMSKITICTESQVSELNPHSYGEDYIYQQAIPEGSEKVVALVLNANDFNEKFSGHDLSHNMFFIYIECDENYPPSPDTPCGLDYMTTLGVTYDYGVFYNQAMNYTRELGDSCIISSNFINFILNTEALKIALETGHYIPAINYWKNLIGDVGKITSKPCGCHG